MHGLMQETPLTLGGIFRRAETLWPTKRLATAGPGGIERTTYGQWADRTRRLGTVLDTLGISVDGRVATFGWNSARHLELYFAAPCTGRVLHTLNIRLFADQLVYIANHAEDEVVFVDRSLLPLLWPHIDECKTVRHVVVMDDCGDREGAAEIPDDARVDDYEALLAAATPHAFADVTDEHQAASMCYTSGTTGDPKGVVYSHRSVVLHSMGACLADTLAVSEADVILPVVPMFHANAWGLCQAAVHGRLGGGLPGGGPDAAGDHQAHRRRGRDAGRRRADHMDGRPAVAGRAAAPAAEHRVRRVGGARGPVRGVPPGDWPADPAGLGHDRDQPARQRGPRPQRPAGGRRLGGGPGGHPGHPGHPHAAGGVAHRLARDGGGPALGRRGQRGGAGAGAVDRPLVLRTTSGGRRRLPPTGGCVPATWPR